MSDFKCCQSLIIAKTQFTFFACSSNEILHYSNTFNIYIVKMPLILNEDKQPVVQMLLNSLWMHSIFIGAYRSQLVEWGRKSLNPMIVISKSVIYIVYLRWYRGHLTVNVQKASVSQNCQHWAAMQLSFFLSLKTGSELWHYLLATHSCSFSSPTNSIT